MTIPCPIDTCERQMPGTAVICAACAGDLARTLGDIPALAHQLDITLSKQTSKTSGGRTTTIPLPYNTRASEIGWVLRNTLSGWVRVLMHAHQTMHAPADELTAMARWLLDHHQTLVCHPAAEEAHDEITAVVRQAERVIDRMAERWYAGRCSARVIEADCDQDLYARPGTPTVTCPKCGAAYDVTERRDWLLAAAEDTLAYGALIAQALTSLGQEVTPERIRTWAARGRIVAHGTDGRGRPQYRVGDVMDLLAGQREKMAG